MRENADQKISVLGCFSRSGTYPVQNKISYNWQAYAIKTCPEKNNVGSIYEVLFSQLHIRIYVILKIHKPVMSSFLSKRSLWLIQKYYKLFHPRNMTNISLYNKNFRLSKFSLPTNNQRLTFDETFTNAEIVSLLKFFFSDLWIIKWGETPDLKSNKNQDARPI